MCLVLLDLFVDINCRPAIAKNKITVGLSDLSST